MSESIEDLRRKGLTDEQIAFKSVEMIMKSLPNTGYVFISASGDMVGNLCLVCVQESLDTLIKDQSIEHFDHVPEGKVH